MTDNDLMIDCEVCLWLRIKHSTLTKWRRGQGVHRSFPHSRISNGIVYFSRREIQDWLADRSTERSTP